MFRGDGRESAREAVTGQWDRPIAALADPDDPIRLAVAFDSGGGVHPGDAGAREKAVDLGLLACGPVRGRRT
ncbi:hypothetical protein [Actinoallomurus acaciae]|uniref:Uncharacterized protein n=1 Tax=Actinoallomurus acaciae TaxID=502577 RepID=A0ABV5YLN9_9ACTN